MWQMEGAGSAPDSEGGRGEGFAWEAAGLPECTEVWCGTEREGAGGHDLGGRQIIDFGPAAHGGCSGQCARLDAAISHTVVPRYMNGTIVQGPDGEIIKSATLPPEVVKAPAFGVLWVKRNTFHRRTRNVSRSALMGGGQASARNAAILKCGERAHRHDLNGRSS